MSLKAIKWAWDLPLKSTEKLVILALADYANDHGDCWPNLEIVAIKCGVHRVTITRVINKLTTDGWLEKTRRNDRNGWRRSNIIRLNFSQSLSEFAQTLAKESKNCPSVNDQNAYTNVADDYINDESLCSATLHANVADDYTNIIEPPIEPKKENKLRLFSKKETRKIFDNDDFVVQKKYRNKKLPLSPDFKPTDRHKALADELQISFDDHLGSFMAHNLGHGALAADWGAMFEGWMRRSAMMRKQKFQVADAIRMRRMREEAEHDQQEIPPLDNNCIVPLERNEYFGEYLHYVNNPEVFAYGN